MKKKYFKGLKLNDFEKEVFGLKKNKKYKKMKKKLGRNEPKYWNYDMSFFIQLYADLNAFVESSNHVDMEYHTFVDVDGKERTQIDMIKHILSLIKYYHKEMDDFDMDKYDELEQVQSKILDNFKIVLPSLWN
ncbi:hypothetical protein phiSA039_0013 [Staphylococcus phage phiSA039]|uniref:Uncharacterized protein n=1 Tax=Staphylococcus phage S25-3 TaxID=1041526 RepID=V5XUK7_BPS25|nr:hypothetical protein X600_gp179 [Staphylococcus phage S25-3]QAU05806.1 hypothetical protein Sa87_033 [Staphylococcus virus Sa87]QEM41282.1 hypothetical protein CPT_Maine_032 [Staphylococcus phage Maine]QKE56089.1 hypothetical protein METROID_33 [Staphylococcus phage Metroid]UXE02388.1 hypothetical protein Biyabedamokiny1_00035 [Staphylococcus phage Biyabeda-mokiny_1]WJJ56829.1 hypothetical protein vBSAP01_038 [Staphylococcus phage vB_SAP01]WLY87175.1 hypothetical protein 357Saur119PP_00196